MNIEAANLRPIIVFLLAVLYQLSSSSALASRTESRGASDSGYELLQFDFETDKSIVQLSRFGLKVTNLKGGTVFICTPPKWEVVAYSTSAKRICRTDWKHFNGEYRVFFRIFQKPGFADIPLEKGTTSKTVRGLAVECSHSTEAFKTKEILGFVHREVKGNYPCFVEYCTSRKLPSSPQIEFVLRRLYDMPQAPGVPIGLTYRRVDQVVESELETLKVSAKRFTAEDFKIPSGLQPVGNIAALRADQGSVDTAAGFIDSVSKFKPR